MSLRAGETGRQPLEAAVALATVALVVAGLAGTYRYLRGYWLYRGFPPPHDPSFVTQQGTAERFYVKSAALGGRSQPVDVYLPPGYATDTRRRYAVLYLLHGFPGRPGAFLQTVRAGVVEDVLLADRKLQPLILVMPFGSTGTFTDKEWANGVHAHEGWETFVASDLVRAVDARYRTIRAGRARALGGLSEGGYGALNIGLHHPREFKVLESWSGYELADNLKPIFGGKRRLLALNSPLIQLRKAVPVLRQDRTFIWFYSSTTDKLRRQNEVFAKKLGQYGIPHRFFVLKGGHTWVLWRGDAARALLAASQHLADG
jgi:enterochelin esterase-like enzyme